MHEPVRLLSTEPKPVNIARLEAELAALWRPAAEAPALQDAVTRSCSLTLLVYVDSEEAQREALDLIDGVTVENPCRVVVIMADPVARPAGLSAQLSARCHLPVAGAKEVCCEEITLMARGEAVGGLEQAVVPLMVPGLPVYLWWRAGRFIPPEYLAPLLHSVDRVLVDSARFPEPETDLPRLLGELRRLPGGTSFTDLNWARLTPWRELIAQCFDSPEARPCLEALSDVRIEYEQASPRILFHRAQSLLLTGWLASRLAWQPVPERSKAGPQGCSFAFRSGQRSILVNTVPRQFEGGGAGGCVSITLKAAGACLSTFSLQRGPEGKVASTRRELPGYPVMERAVRLQAFDEVELLSAEIRFAGRDRVYEEALGMIGQLVPFQLFGADLR